MKKLARPPPPFPPNTCSLAHPDIVSRHTLSTTCNKGLILFETAYPPPSSGRLTTRSAYRQLPQASPCPRAPGRPPRAPRGPPSPSTVLRCAADGAPGSPRCRPRRRRDQTLQRPGQHLWSDRAWATSGRRHGRRLRWQSRPSPGTVLRWRRRSRRRRSRRRSCRPRRRRRHGRPLLLDRVPEGSAHDNVHQRRRSLCIAYAVQLQEPLILDDDQALLVVHGDSVPAHASETRAVRIRVVYVHNYISGKALSMELVRIHKNRGKPP